MSMDGPIMVAGAVSYALKAAALLTPDDMANATPCADWDMTRLVQHLCDSIAAFDEGLGTGALCTDDHDAVTGAIEPVELLRDRAAELLCTLFTTDCRVIEIDGLPISADLALAAGALEIAVHGWDIYVASGHGRPLPGALARPLNRVIGQLVLDRRGLFASPVATPPCAGAGDRLIAFLGRDPAARHTSYSRVA